MKRTVLWGLGFLLVFLVVLAHAQNKGGPNFQGTLSVTRNFEGGGATVIVNNANEPGVSDIAIDFEAGGNLFGNIGLTDLETENARFFVLQNNPSELNLTLIEDGNGNVGIGLTNPSVRLDVNGDVRAAAFLVSSDGQMKKDIETIPDALDKLSSLRGVRFEWRTDEFKERKLAPGKHMGVIAQEVEKVIPELVVTSKDGYKSVAYANLTALLIEALKELRAEKEALAARVATLEALVELRASAQPHIVSMSSSR